MAKKNEPKAVVQKPEINVERMQQRLDMLDQRLDNIDSIVTAIAERVMKQLLTINITCSKCGQNMEIALIGTEKPRR